VTIEVRDADLQIGSRTVPFAAIGGLHERYDRVTGAAFLDVLGPGVRIPMDSAYGPIRTALRAKLADRPWTSDWQDGRFPSAPGGLPPDLATVGATLLAALLTGLAGFVAGPFGALVFAIAATWPIVRLRDSVRVTADGLSIGPPWAHRYGWHELTAVRMAKVGRSVRIWSLPGGAAATVPVALVPVLKGRLWRLGGLSLEEAPDGLDAAYERWRGPASGLPWGVMAGTLVGSAFVADPWPIVVGGALITAATTLLGAAVEARATGWGTGAILAASGVYAVVLAAVAIGAGGWLY
jgi:hypothetical protein